MNTADQHAAALAIVHEEAGRTLSKDDFDLCMRIAKRALPSDAAQAPEPVAYCRRDTVLDWRGQLVNAAMMFPSPAGLKDPIALYAVPVASASVTPIVKVVQLLAFLCRTETKRLDDETLKALGEVEDQLVALGFSVRNDDGELSTTDSAFGEARAAARDGTKILENLWNDPNGPMLRGQWQARATAPQAVATLTDEQILNAFELSGVEFQEVYSTTLKKWLPLTKGPQNANRLISAVRALLSAQPTRTPIYQIGAPGIAGHQVVWWDVPQEEYEREKKAGYMRTGIVYREGE